MCSEAGGCIDDGNSGAIIVHVIWWLECEGWVLSTISIFLSLSVDCFVMNSWSSRTTANFEGAYERLWLLLLSDINMGSSHNKN